jgi:hypothetical protein
MQSQQVTIFGSGFGATQGNGAVQLGSTYAAVLIWTDAYIVATVAPSAQSGVAQVFQAGLASNQIGLTILSPDTITASASPAPNSNGWNNSSVTVTSEQEAFSKHLPRKEMEVLLGDFKVDSTQFRLRHQQPSGSLAELYWEVTVSSAIKDGRLLRWSLTFEAFGGKLTSISRYPKDR